MSEGSTQCTAVYRCGHVATPHDHRHTAQAIPFSILQHRGRAHQGAHPLPCLLPPTGKLPWRTPSRFTSQSIRHTRSHIKRVAACRDDTRLSAAGAATAGLDPLRTTSAHRAPSPTTQATNLPANAAHPLCTLAHQQTRRKHKAPSRLSVFKRRRLAANRRSHKRSVLGPSVSSYPAGSHPHAAPAPARAQNVLPL